MKGDYFSESEDENCIVKDDNEENTVVPYTKNNILDERGSFKYNMNQIHDFGK